MPYVFTTGYDMCSVARQEADTPRFEKPVIATQVIAALFDRGD